MKKKLCLYILTFIMVLGLTAPAPACAQGPGNFIFVVADGLSMDDMKNNDLPNIKRLMDKSGVAVMNTNAEQPKNEPGSFLTIGVGTRAYSGVDSSQGYNTDEEYIGSKLGKAGEFYNIYTGKKPEGEVVVPGLVQIGVANEDSADVQPGLLGETLKKAGIPVTVLGNSDRPDKERRYAPLIVMDENGVVPFGDVSSRMNIRDEKYPFLLKANYKYLNKKLDESLDRGGLTVIDLGDMARADDLMSFATDENGPRVRSEVLKSIDGFIGTLLDKMDFSKDMLVIANPYPGRDAMENQEMLTPVIAAGPGLKSGYLISDTAKRPGIVANYDITSTILNYFGQDTPDNMIGHTMRYGGQGSFGSLYEQNQKITSIHVMRPTVVTWYVGVQIGILLVSLLFMYVFKKQMYVLKYLLMGDMLIPFILLILPLFDIRSLPVMLITITLLSAILVYVLKWAFKDSYSIMTVIGILTTVGIAVDLLTGANLMKSSILGYDPIGGARYYGLGNEYAGVLLGSTILSVAGVMDRHSDKTKNLRFINIAAMFFIAFLMAAPSYGADLGGTIAAIMAFLMMSIMFFKDKISFKDIVYSTIVMVAVIVCLFIVDMSLGATHIGELARNVAVQGFGPLNEIALRKLATNLKLIKYTIWSRVMLASIAVLGALSYKPRGLMKNIFADNPYLYRGFISGLIGTFFVLVANDSGIVAAATLIIYMVPPIVVLAIDKIIKNDNKESIVPDSKK